MFIPRTISFKTARPVTQHKAPRAADHPDGGQAGPLPWPAALAPLSRPQNGLLEGTLLESRAGWVPIESLRPGDELYTYDGGLRRISALHRRRFEIRRSENAPAFLVQIPGGLLGCTCTTLLMPEQRLLIESPFLEEEHDFAAALVRAADLIGIRGIRMDIRARARHILMPEFEEEEIFWASSGLLCHAPTGHEPFGSGFFPELHRHEARALVRRELEAGESALMGGLGALQGRG